MNKEELRELAKTICDEIDSKDIEDIYFFEVKGVSYSYCEIEKLDTIDEGKYQHGGVIYGIGLTDEEYGYGVIGEPLFYIKQVFSQTGSYYNEQERYFEKPHVVKKVKRIVEIEKWVIQND